MLFANLQECWRGPVPEETARSSPAFQRWEEGAVRPKSRRDGWNGPALENDPLPVWALAARRPQVMLDA